MIAVSCQEMRELDRRAVEEFGIPSKVLMENAGRVVAEESVKLIQRLNLPKPWKISIFCGGGNNGGDGFVAARILKEKNFSVKMVLLKPINSLKGDALLNFEKIKDLIPYDVLPTSEQIEQNVSQSSLVMDAILGTGFKGEIDKPLKEAIEVLNRTGKPIVSVDLPSGLDADSGNPQGVCIHAHLTVTMGAMKIGFLRHNARKWTGEIIIADIGFPKELFNGFKSDERKISHYYQEHK